MHHVNNYHRIFSHMKNCYPDEVWGDNSSYIYVYDPHFLGLKQSNVFISTQTAMVMRYTTLLRDTIYQRDQTDKSATAGTLH